MAIKLNLIGTLYRNKVYEYKTFMRSVVSFFEENPLFRWDWFPHIHSIKSRIKDPSHLEEKIKRKLKNGKNITADNLFSEVTDIAGVRVFYLHQGQFSVIHKEIMSRIGNDWKLFEEPKAYTWDPESEDFYKALHIKTEVNPRYYTSIHYVVMPNNETANICCEIQVRTLFEEIWWEIDHAINYPNPTNDIWCKEQLRVLSKLVGTWTRLADSIFRTHDEYLRIRKANKKRKDIRIKW